MTENTHTTENSHTQMEIHTYTYSNMGNAAYWIDIDVYQFYIMIAYFYMPTAQQYRRFITEQSMQNNKTITSTQTIPLLFSIYFPEAHNYRNGWLGRNNSQPVGYQ